MDERSPNAGAGPATKEESRPSVLLGIVGWVTATLLLTAGLFTLIAYMHGNWSWPDTQNDPDWIRTVVLSTLPTAGVLAGAAVVAITVRRQKTAEDNLKVTREQFEHVRDEAAAATSRTNDLIEREQIAALRDRFVTAAAQLGDPAEAVQVAGVYSLSALADDWIRRGERAEAQACIRLLCAFLKSSTIPALRSTIFEVMGEKLAAPSPAWDGFSLDLSGIEFAEGDRVRWRQLRLGAETTIRLDHAKMAGGHLDLSNLRLEGGRVSFAGADLRRGSLLFGGSWFSSGQILFKGTKFGTSMKVGLRPRELRKGVVSFIAARGNVPVLVVPPSNEHLAARKARKALTASPTQ